jgi:hypothetical protein
VLSPSAHAGSHEERPEAVIRTELNARNSGANRFDCSIVLRLHFRSSSHVTRGASDYNKIKIKRIVSSSHVAARCGSRSQ